MSQQSVTDMIVDFTVILFSRQKQALDRELSLLYGTKEFVRKVVSYMFV